MKSIEIIATGKYLPKKKIENKKVSLKEHVVDFIIHC